MSIVNKIKEKWKLPAIEPEPKDGDTKFENGQQLRYNSYWGQWVNTGKKFAKKLEDYGIWTGQWIEIIEKDLTAVEQKVLKNAYNFANEFIKIWNILLFYLWTKLRNLN